MSSEAESLDAIANHLKGIYAPTTHRVKLPPWRENGGAVPLNLSEAIGLATILDSGKARRRIRQACPTDA